MMKRMVVGMLAFGLVGAVTFAKTTPASASVSASEGSGHRPIACLPKGAHCTYSSDCCSGSCAGASPAECQ